LSCEQRTWLAEKDKILIIEEKVYELPTEEEHALTIVEVTDLGAVETNFGTKEKISIKIDVTDQKTKTGDNIYVFVTAAKSIGEKSTLGKFLRKLGINPQKSFDMDDLIGFKFRAVIEHNVATNGKTYANVGSIIKRKTPAIVESV
jgi:hypothetical protein